MSILALIPARGGSKGVPKKNIRLLNGIPLIAHTILAANKVGRLSRVVVSTDSEEIAEVSRHYGAEVPFLRPVHLSDDTASSIDVIIHALDYYRDLGINYQHIVLLQPTSPLRDSTDIENSLNIYQENSCDGVISVCDAAINPYLYKTIDSEGCLQDFIPSDIKHMRRQDMLKTYQLNGAVYITSAKLLKEHRNFYMGRVLPYIMSPEKSIDVDTEFDLKLADFLIKEKMINSGSY